MARERLGGGGCCGKPVPYYLRKVDGGKIEPGLAEKGVTVISGLARGNGRCAHQGALDVGGSTIAALGCGLGVVYPPENRGLMERIGCSEAIISEFSLFTKPDRLNFPVRNRLISGLSLGTLVIEAASHSDSLITADFSLEQGREVFAVPSPAYSPKSKGTHKLIKEGAKLVEDVFEEFSPAAIESLELSSILADGSTLLKGLSAQEELVMPLVSEEGVRIDTIAQQS